MKVAEKMKSKKVMFKPLGKNLLVLAPKAKKETKAGIIKSDSMIKEEEAKMDKYHLIVAISDEIDSVKIGDRILVSGKITIIEIDDEIYGIVHEAAIIGVRL